MTDLVSRDINWARKITERLRLQATNYQEAREKVLATLAEARDGGAADLLGYASWTAYMADVFADAPLRLERDARQELVAELAAEGMSTRAIAPIVGVHHDTVASDIKASGPVGNPTPPMNAVEPQTMMRVNPDTGEVEDVPARHITGMDGKEYAVPVRQPKPKSDDTDSSLVALINDLRGPWSRGITDAARRMEPTARQHVIDALENTLNKIKEIQS